jgi:hypothetical protein
VRTLHPGRFSGPSAVTGSLYRKEEWAIILRQAIRVFAEGKAKKIEGATRR